MTTFITGASGNTPARVAELLLAANQPVLVGSRKAVAPEPLKAVKFDWSDPETFQNPFNADHNITRVYLVAPPGGRDLLPTVKPFIDLAVEKGVKRFVFCSASAIPRGGPFHGGIHEYLATIGVEYAVLRPTWFSDNFTSSHIQTIMERDEFSSPSGDGRIPFVSSKDIAQTAFDKLTEEKSSDSDFYVVGPQYYTYDEAAEVLSKVIGRKITHRRTTEDEDYAKWKSFNLNDEYARGLAHLHAEISKGVEELLDQPNTIIGKQSLEEYVVENRTIWLK